MSKGLINHLAVATLIASISALPATAVSQSPAESGARAGGNTAPPSASTPESQAAIEAARRFCPADAAAAQLKLEGVSLVREQGIALMYEGFNILEGPVWHDGALFYSNIGNSAVGTDGAAQTNQATIWRWEPGTEPSVWLDSANAGTNGLAVDFEGRLVATRQLDGTLARIDWKSRKLETIAGKYEDKRFNSPNDLVIAHDGAIYFTDPNWNIPASVDRATTQGGGKPGSTEPGQRAYRIDADGTVRVLAVTELVPDLRDKPNGILLSLDEQQLYIGGLRGLWVFDLKHGQVSNPRQLLKTAVDGVTKDCAGNIYVTTSRPLPERRDSQVVVILDPDHKELGVLNVPGIQSVTNVAFGGEDGKTLFVTSLTFPNGNNGQPTMCGDQPCLPASIYSAKLNIAGFPY